MQSILDKSMTYSLQCSMFECTVPVCELPKKFLLLSWSRTVTGISCCIIKIIPTPESHHDEVHHSKKKSRQNRDKSRQILSCWEFQRQNFRIHSWLEHVFMVHFIYYEQDLCQRAMTVIGTTWYESGTTYWNVFSTYV